MKLTFLGAAGEVTGSCHLVEAGGARFLLDCGMFQGGRDADRRNAGFEFDPRSIDFVLLSHAHIDHSGLLPRLVARGFRGAIYATPATAELLAVMLPDSAYLQEKEAARASRGRRRAVAPLYTVDDAKAALRRVVTFDYDAPVRPHPAVRCAFRDAGHILGSAILEVWLREGPQQRKLVFSGDLGQPGHPIVKSATPIASADVLLVESTYGDRNHKNLAQTLDEFAYALTDTLASRRGNVVVPAFAVGRTQDLLVLMAELRRQGRIPPCQVYVDSPMATAATRITLRHATLPRLDWVHFTESVEDSMRINDIRAGAVILSASGMCEGGRVKHHLRYNLGRPECAVVFAGFQAAGTLGRRIVDGAKAVRIYGESVPVRAKVFTIGGLSAHADRDALLAWLGRFRRPPAQAWVVHGEPGAAEALRAGIEERFAGWRPRVARRLQAVPIG